MTVAENHQRLLQALLSIPDRQERLAAIVERGHRGRPFPTQFKTPAHRVAGCVSAVWVHCERAGTHLSFLAAAESPVVNGLVRLLCELYDDTDPVDVIATEPALLSELGLLGDLTPTRQNGLAAVRRRLRESAQTHLSLP